MKKLTKGTLFLSNYDGQIGVVLYALYAEMFGFVSGKFIGETPLFRKGKIKVG
jgi:hypothetical protein